MRILVVNSFFPPRTTGSAHFSLDVAREYVRNGHEVLVLTTSVADAPDEEDVDGMHVVRVPAFSVTPGNLAFNYALPFAIRPGASRRVRRIVRSFAPDIIHQNGQFFDLTFLITWAAIRSRIPRVLTVHTPLVHTTTSLRIFIGAVDRTVLRLLNAPGRPVMVGVDRFCCELAEARYRPAAGPVRFIPATLQVEKFHTGDGTAIRERYGLGDAPVLLSIGHVIPIRSRVPLVRALPYVMKEHPDVKVLVVGQVYSDEFLRVADELGVRDHLIVTGRVPHHEVPDFLAAATVESHDLDGHGLGITTMEVMAAHVPVFARVRRDVFPSVDLDDWPDLQIVESAEPAAIAAAINLLLSTPEVRDRVAQRQYEFVERHFRAEVVAGEYLELFEGILAGRPPAGRPIVDRGVHVHLSWARRLRDALRGR